MNLPPFIARRFDNSEYNILRGRVKLLTHQVQASTDITTNTDSTSVVAYTGTPSRYSTYSQQVTQLGKLYDNTADWGCMIAKNVIDMRTAFSVGTGVRVVKEKSFEGDAKEELKWVKAFMRFNNLDEEMPQEFAKEAEIEGKVLLRFLVDTVKKNIRIIHVPWRKFNYTITTPEWTFYDYINAKYIGSGATNIKFDLTDPWFVYRRFGGTVDKINETPPKTAFILREMEDLDKALVDWRRINTIFAAPTPTFTSEDSQTAKEIQDWLDGKNFKIGKGLSIGGMGVKYELVGWKGDGFTTLQFETVALVKTISGTTGIPVQFLGYPELLSNRDTAENLMEFIALSTDKERNTWTGAYEELFHKAMILSNTYLGTNLNPMAVDSVIDRPELTTMEGGGGSNASVSKRPDTSSQPDRT